MIDRDEWSSCLDMMRPYCEVFLCGDFNAHHVSCPGSGSSPSNIDLIFCPLALFSIAKVQVIDDPFGSDHLPVVLELETAVSAMSRPTCRINTGDMTWARFHELLEADLPRLRGSLESGVPPVTVYDREQTAEKKAEFKKIDSEVKIFLRRQKRSSFRVFCESMDSSQGISKIWGTLRALTSRTGALRSNVLTDSNSPEFEMLRTELVREQVPATDIPLRVIEGTVEQLDESFSRREFDAAMAACRAKSAPGLDGVSYEILRRFSRETRAFLLRLFNGMFQTSSYPASWRDTYVIFIPKPGGKGYRTISLSSSVCKLFERMVHRRLEHQA